MPDSDTPSLEQLIHTQPHLWRGRTRSGHHNAPVISTGFAELDASLPDGGWPASGLMEWIVPHWGVGELRLLMPLLLHLNSQARWCAWLSAPYTPYAPALVSHGFDLRYLLIINRISGGKTKQVDQNLFWSMEKLLANPACGVVLAWPQQPSVKHLRRLQSVATNNKNLVIIFQQQALANTPTPLRIRLTSENNNDDKALNIEILKARGSLSRRSLRLVL